MPRVNPEILVWARETAGLEREEAARKIGLRPARGREPEERLEALEQGEVDPTRFQLVEMARVYRRPLLTFYLARPPRQGDRGRDFRTQAEDAPVQEQAWLDALIRELRARHGLVRDALAEDEDVETVAFVGNSRMNDGVEVLTQRMTSLLDFRLETFRRSPTKTRAFAYLRERIEELGVLTILAGDLGSHHTRISSRTFRGYAMADDLAPVIVVNDNDARAAWSFTLLHELCHLMIGQTGVSAGFSTLEVEQFCNDVASRLLLPEGDLDELLLEPSSAEAQAASITAWAEPRNLSRSLVAYRLYRAGRLGRGRWEGLRRRFQAEWLDHRRRQRELARESDSSGPTYYTVRRHRLGPALLETVSYLLNSGALSVVKAGRVLGVKPTNVHRTLPTTAG